MTFVLVFNEVIYNYY